MKTNKRTYIKIIDLLQKAPMTRKELISAYISSLGLTREQLSDRSTHGRANIERSLIGALINDMCDKGMIVKGEDSRYTPSDQKPIIIRNERCESEILKMLDGQSLTKAEIRKNLTKIFGTDTTVTEKDDSKLFAYMGDALRRMVDSGAINICDSRYTLSGKVSAQLSDISSLLNLQNSFLTRIHRKGGEFFEVYFMNLLEKYLLHFGKEVVSNTVTGGSADGGIDGIIETVDPLGFKETIMIQTKNRNDTTTETSVRGFYGAVCARQGSRGIYATSSDFHAGAKKFLQSIDNCVGVDGEKLFEMARLTCYGLKKSGNELTIDEKII